VSDASSPDRASAGRPTYDARTALIVVDVQNDFADPAGSLYVEGGEQVVPLVNDEIAAAREAGATVVLTQDWHPPSTPHFVDQGGTWPAHCVRGTWGAELHADLDREADLVIRKGTGGEDGYSAFTVIDPQRGDRHPTGLAGFLRERGIDAAVVVGLAADVCVNATAVDAAHDGLRTTVRWDATRAVEVHPGDADRARDEMLEAGVVLVGAP
jgi:nicotinamidase/pyrazinamidase